MRYDTPIYFQKVVPGEYDESTGDYNDDAVEETMKFASVISTDADTITLIYGKIKQGILTVSLQRHYTDPYDRIRNEITDQTCFGSKWGVGWHMK